MPGYAAVSGAGGGHIATRHPRCPGTDDADRPAGEASHGRQRQWHRTDLVGDPALVAGASGRRALYRAGEADAERIRRELVTIRGARQNLPRPFRLQTRQRLAIVCFSNASQSLVAKSPS